ncbi:copia protein [Tanacetum coccineum]
MTKNVTEHEPKKVIQALQDLSCIEAMQEELLNKKDKRCIIIRNKARLVAQGYTQEKGIDYDEVFAPVARIEEIRLFLAYASFKDFIVYQMNVKSAFLYGKIKEEVYVCQPPGFEDPEFPDRVYKDDIIFGFTKKSLCNEFEKLMHKKFQMRSMGELTFFLGLQVTQKDDGIFISQDKYVDEILKKFGFSTIKTASTPIETSKPLLKDAEAEDVDVHLYRSMIGSLMYLTTSRPDIMFADSPFDLEAYTDSDYAGASLDRKSTIGGCQFLGSRLISWQCKKQTVVANSTIEAEDFNEKKLIQMIKIHTDQNVADLLTKAFDVSRFQYLIMRLSVTPPKIQQRSGIPLGVLLHNTPALRLYEITDLSDVKPVKHPNCSGCMHLLVSVPVETSERYSLRLGNVNQIVVLYTALPKTVSTGLEFTVHDIGAMVWLCT